jgi:hypothetical protein
MNVEALWEVRVRTEQLELRLPTEDELVELFRVAEGGIHPPEEMPFLVPWTDDLRLEAFVDFHRAAWESWRPEQWSLNLVTFLEGRPIGRDRLVARGTASRPRFRHRAARRRPRARIPRAPRSRRRERVDRPQHQLAARVGEAGLPGHGHEEDRAARRARRPLRLSPRTGRVALPIPVELDGLASSLPLFGAVTRSS